MAESFPSRDGETEQLSAFVPESVLRPGRNTLELFEVVRGPGGRLSLALLGRA